MSRLALRTLRLAAVAGLAASLAGAPAAAADPPPFGVVTSVAAPRGQAVRAAVLADIDGDGRDDLVVSTRRPGKRPVRSLRVHLRRATEPAFAPEPDATFDTFDDIVAFAVADVDPEPGAEIALFMANSVHAWRPRAPEDRRFVRLLAADFLFQVADPKEVWPFESSVHDVDGDGIADLVLPEPEGYRIALQRRVKDGDAVVSRFDAPSFLRVPDDEAAPEGGETRASRKMRAKAAKREIRIALQIGGEGEAPGDLLAVTEGVPAPQLRDFDGDGRLDVLAQTTHQLHVWRQHADGAFGESPDSSFDLPVVADRSRRLDVSYSAQSADLDGDRRADVVFFSSDRNSDAVRTQIQVFTQKGGTPASPLFGAEGLPQQLLVVTGFAGTPRFADVDGDGRADLTAASMRLDAMDAVAAAAKGRLDAELYVYRNRGGTFSREPDLRFPVTIGADGFRHGGEGLVLRFVADATGDGVRDLLLRDDPTHLRLLMVRRAGEKLSVVPQPLFETFVAEDARISVVERDRAPPEVLVIEDQQVRHVRFR